MSDESCIRLDRVSKRFGGVQALAGVSFEIRRGEIHAVMGGNGAGKSTLMKLLAGVHVPDEGEIRLEGRPVRLTNARESRRRGIGIVFQELNLFPHRTVAANIFANRELCRPWGVVRHGAMREAARRVLAEMETALSPDALVGSLSIGEQQQVEIARALQQQPRIIILDEPNSALNEAESRRLFEIIRRLRDRGMTILYVSHRLEEVFAIADRITVLRDGRYEGTCATAETSIPRVIAAMIGRPLDPELPPRPPARASGPVVLEVRDLCCGPRLGPISFTARAGEIMGFAGLEGAGVNELFRTLFGLDTLTGGEIRVGGVSRQSGTPLGAMRQGWGMVPESRREQGLMMDGSIARNTTLLVLGRLLSRLGLIDRGKVRDTTHRYLARLRIAHDAQGQRVAELSGGNQQKVLLAKWLATAPRILILNDPTRGVDVGAKQEIHDLCRQLAGEGITLLLASSEADELLGLADRVLVLARGRVVREFEHGAATKEGLIHAMAGQAPPPAGAGPPELTSHPPSNPNEPK